MIFSKQIKNKKQREICEMYEEQLLSAAYDYVESMVSPIWHGDESKAQLLMKMGRYYSLLRAVK